MLYVKKTRWTGNVLLWTATVHYFINTVTSLLKMDGECPLYRMYYIVSGRQPSTLEFLSFRCVIAAHSSFGVCSKCNQVCSNCTNVDVAMLVLCSYCTPPNIMYSDQLQRLHTTRNPLAQP